MEHTSTLYVIREGFVPDKGKYLSEEDGFISYFRDALTFGSLGEATEVLRTAYIIIDSKKEARIVRVESTWKEYEETPRTAGGSV